jgi:hypothetical protein
MLIGRRSFLTGLGALIAAPAVVHAGVLMPVRGVVIPTIDIIDHTYYGPALMTVEEITREAARIFTSTNQFIKNLNAQYDYVF